MNYTLCALLSGVVCCSAMGADNILPEGHHHNGAPLNVQHPANAIPLEQRVYVIGDEGGGVTVLNALNNQIVGNPIGGGGSLAICFPAQNEHLYLFGYNTVQDLNTESNQIEGTIEIHGTPTAVAANPLNQSILFLLCQNMIHVFNTETMHIDRTINVEDMRSNFVFSPDGSKLHVFSPRRNRMISIDTTNYDMTESPQIHGAVYAAQFEGGRFSHTKSARN